MTQSAPRTPPRAVAGASWAAALLALALLALGLVAMRDLATSQDWARGEPWIPAAVDTVDGLDPTGDWLLPVAIAAGLVGLWLVLIGLKPRRRTHLPIDDPDLDVWVSPGAVQSLLVSVADREPGVVSATARVGRRLDVRLRVAADRDLATVEDAARQQLSEAIAGVTAKRLQVRSQRVVS